MPGLYSGFFPNAACKSDTKFANNVLQVIFSDRQGGPGFWPDSILDLSENTLIPEDIYNHEYQTQPAARKVLYALARMQYWHMHPGTLSGGLMTVCHTRKVPPSIRPDETLDEGPISAPVWFFDCSFPSPGSVQGSSCQIPGIPPIGVSPTTFEPSIISPSPPASSLYGREARQF